MSARATGDLNGRLGVVLGVSQANSLGYAIAEDFSLRGATLAVSTRPGSSEGARVAGSLSAIPLEIDAQSDESVSNAFSLLEQRWSRLDFVVHTWMHVTPEALKAPLSALPYDSFQESLDIGVYSLLRVVGAALPLLEKSDSPRLVALTSEGAGQVIPSYHLAGITKAALDAAVRYLAHELGPKGVLCNLVSAGAIATAGASKTVGMEAMLSTQRYMAKKSPTRGATTPDDVAKACAYLCGHQCTQVTGHKLLVDGGFSSSYL